MNTSETKIQVRVRAVIIVDERLLCVRHKKDDKFLALPGGHLEFGEDIYEAMKRELIEELGVTPELGKLLYVYNWIRDQTQNIEFFIEVKNGYAYKDVTKLVGTHSFEISEIVLADTRLVDELLPKEVGSLFMQGKLLGDTPLFLYKP